MFLKHSQGNAHNTLLTIAMMAFLEPFGRTTTDRMATEICSVAHHKYLIVDLWMMGNQLLQRSSENWMPSTENQLWSTLRRVSFRPRKIGLRKAIQVSLDNKERERHRKKGLRMWLWLCLLLEDDTRRTRFDRVQLPLTSSVLACCVSFNLFFPFVLLLEETNKSR